MNDGEASRVFVGDDAEILNTPSWVDVQIKQIKLEYNMHSNIILDERNGIMYSQNEPNNS